MNIKTCVQHKVHYPVSMKFIYYWTDITFLLFFSDQKSFYTLPKQLRDRGCGNKSWWLLHLCVWGPGGSSRWLITAWQQQGSSLLFRKPNSYPGPGPYLISKVIFVCVCVFLLSIICHRYTKTILCWKATTARQSRARLSSTKPYLPVL